MSGHHHFTEKVLKAILIVENVLFAFIGLALTVLGIYLLAVGQNLNFITSNASFSGSVLVLSSGIITMLVAILGLAAAVLEFVPLLTIYIFCICAMAIAEVVSSFVVFANLSEISSRASSEMVTDIENYALSTDQDYDAGTNQFVDSVQNLFECCGVNGPEDWVVYNLPYCIANKGLPESCACGNADSDSCFIIHFSGYTFSTWTKGCNESFSDFLNKHSSAIGATFLLLGLAEALAVALSCWLLCISFSRSGRFQYSALGHGHHSAYGTNS